MTIDSIPSAASASNCASLTAKSRSASRLRLRMRTADPDSKGARSAGGAHVARLYPSIAARHSASSDPSAAATATDVTRPSSSRCTAHRCANRWTARRARFMRVGSTSSDCASRVPASARSRRRSVARNCPSKRRARSNATAARSAMSSTRPRSSRPSASNSTARNALMIPIGRPRTSRGATMRLPSPSSLARVENGGRSRSTAEAPRTWGSRRRRTSSAIVPG